MTSTLKPEPEKILLPATRDQLHSELIAKVRLNRYDLRFMNNIYSKYLAKDLPLSPGQNELYEKIIHKYRKQLKKLGVLYRNVIELPWKNGIVSINTLNQKTFFKIGQKDDGTPEMQLYFNFNKVQIEEVRAIVHDDEGNHLNRGAKDSFGSGQKYNFSWNNTNKTWYGPFDVYLFKKLYEFANKIDVKLDKSVTELVAALNANGTAEEWTPSVRIVHDRLYVSHIAETMMPILETIDPTDLSVVNVERLTRLGLAAPAEFTHIAEYMNSVGMNIKHEIHTPAQAGVLKQYIKESGRKVVFYSSKWDRGSTTPTEFVATESSSGDDWDSNVLRYDIDKKFDAGTIENLVAQGYNTFISTTPITGLYRSQELIGKFAVEADKVIYISIAGKT